MTVGVRSPASVESAEALAGLAERALDTGEEEAALPRVRSGAERHASALLWQWAALLERSLDDQQSALRSFGEAVRLAPRDPRIAQGLAQTTLEAGLNAIDLFERAHLLAPQDGAIIVGLAAARSAAGQGERAAAELASLLERAPMWTFGHEQLAQLLSILGRPEEATSSIERAIKRFPSSPELWKALLHVQLTRRDFRLLAETVGRALAAGARSPDFALYSAVHAAETSKELRPAALFDDLPPAMGPSLDVWRVRHFLRLGAVEAALPIIDQGIKGPQSDIYWPYASSAWRITKDPRWEWLESDPAFVQTFDLRSSLPPLEDLSATLNSLHIARGEYLDQSVRGGTQTDGPLFCRIDPVIRHVRAAIVTAVEEYRSKLPPIDPSHPLLRHRRDRRVRFSGSWSVWLRSGGRHSNHVHPQGWISSALYVSLPPKHPADPADAGWLTLGEADDQLGLGLPPCLKIEPKPGRLVLFPSWMWHGTVPFTDGERLTVAFDVRTPI